MNRERLLNIVSNRIFRNITFWILLGSTTVYSIGALLGGLSLEEYVMFFLLQLGTFGPMLYINNLILVPKLFLERKFGLYAITAATIIAVNSFHEQNVHNFIIDYIPDADLTEKFRELPYPTAFIQNFIALLAFTMVLFGSNWLENRNKFENLKKERIKGELDNLRSQINPHFLFNTLNTIYGLARKKDQETAEAIMTLSDILRYVLYDCNTHLVALSKEVEYLENFIQFAKLRYQDKSRIELKVEGDLSGKQIAPLILIPFIENSFKHGLDKHIKDPWVEIDLTIKDDWIYFKCANIHSIKENKQDHQPGGIGLENVQKRLDLIYHNNFQLDIDETEDSYTVSLKVKVQ